MDDEADRYDLSVMSGCLKGRVPTLVDIDGAIASKLPVKYVVVSTLLPIYGYIESHDEVMHSINFKPDPDSIIENIRLDRILLFSAAPLVRDVPVGKGFSIIVGDELFTVVNSNEHGMSVWHGHEGLIYYGEDIQSIIIERGGYTCIDIPR